MSLSQSLSDINNIEEQPHPTKMSQNQHFYVQNSNGGLGFGNNYPKRLIKALSVAQIIVAVVAIVPHFCILGGDSIEK